MGGVYVLLTTFGLPGAALAWLLRAAIDCVLMLVTGRCWDRHLARAVPSSCLVFTCWILAQLMPASYLWPAATAVVMGIAILAVGLIFDPNSRRTASAFIPAAIRNSHRFSRLLRSA